MSAARTGADAKNGVPTGAVRLPLRGSWRRRRLRESVSEGANGLGIVHFEWEIPRQMRVEADARNGAPTGDGEAAVTVRLPPTRRQGWKPFGLPSFGQRPKPRTKARNLWFRGRLRRLPRSNRRFERGTAQIRDLRRRAAGHLPLGGRLLGGGVGISNGRLRDRWGRGGRSKRRPYGGVSRVNGVNPGGAMPGPAALQLFIPHSLFPIPHFHLPPQFAVTNVKNKFTIACDLELTAVLWYIMGRKLNRQRVSNHWVW